MEYTGVISKYIKRLPIDGGSVIVSLHEGNTPLIKLNNIVKNLELDIALYAKYEGLNPTGSFKDRGMTVAVTKAIEKKGHGIICASTGNTSASAAAYAARAGIKAFVLIPAGKIALGKLAQAMMHGAFVIQIEGNFDQGLQIVKDVATPLELTIVNSLNPYRLQGQKTAAFEVVEQLGGAPDYHCLPVGNAGNITAYWMGYTEYEKAGLIKKSPVMCGYQASGAAPFLKGHAIENPETVATAIRIGHPESWDAAHRAQEASKGWFAQVTDDEILSAQSMLAKQEGIFCEPASAASLAGCLNDINLSKIPPGATVVCTLTGHGLKDPDIALSESRDKVIKIEPTLNAVQKQIESHMRDAS